MTPKTILAIPCDYFACGNWRIIQPFKYFSSEHLRVGIYTPNAQVNLDAFDALFLQRPAYAQLLDIARQFKEKGKKVFVDVDDRFPIADPSHRDYAEYGEPSEIWRVMRGCLELADGVIVSTPQLEGYYQTLNPRVLIALNAIHLGSPTYQSPPHPHLPGRTVMFWSGQLPGHGKNLGLIKAAVEEAAARVPDLCLAICGPQEFVGLFALPAERLYYIQPMQFDEFGRLASAADFTLAPLEFGEFNDCKSEIRLLESAAWRVPCVASPAAPYQRFSDNSDGGCLLAPGNTHAAWLDGIFRLATDASLRQELGTRARRAVELHYDLSAENRKREAFILGAWAEADSP